MNSIRLLFISFSFFVLVSCTQGTSTHHLASTAVAKQLILCSPFKNDGFEGVLTTNENNQLTDYDSDTVSLFFNNVPESFKSDKDSFIQLRAINYSNNTKQVGPSPLELRYYNYRDDTFPQLKNYIDHRLIQRSDSDIDQFFFDHRFILQDIAGWQSVFIGLFNVSENLIAQVQALIPPFTINPYTYKEEHTDQRLYSLHPFFNLINAVSEDDVNVFLSKAESACENF